jgi:cap2 methyltransferase
MRKGWCKLETNPHAAQSNDPITGIPFTRILTSDAPQCQYRRRVDEYKSTIHWGQRKLLMSEIEFLLLTLVPGEKCTVVYAGAAPGTHVGVLADMFPLHTFILVDPAPFTVRPERGRIIIHQGMFTDELASLIRRSLSRSTRLLFISDVRSCDYNFHSDDVNDARIREDMRAQARWHGILQPFKSMMKFKLPYTPGKSKYMKGNIYLPVWGPLTTTECRLVVDTHPASCHYDHTEHENRMFFFNTVTRVALYPHSVCGCGIDHCYDCTAEIYILRSYLRAMHRDITARDETIQQVSATISSRISFDRTLAHENPDPAVRVNVIRNHQWSDGMPLYEKHVRKEEARRRRRHR